MARVRAWSMLELGLATLLACAVLFGGGPWSVAEAILGLLSLCFIAWSYQWQRWAPQRAWGRVEWGLIGGFAAIVLTQSLPVPWNWWSAISGREGLASDLALAGVAPGPRAPGLDGSFLAQRIGASLPGLAVILGCLAADWQRLRQMMGLLVGLGVVSALWGFAQVLEGPESALRLHDFHNRVGALGWFSYRNAHGAFLLMLIPLCSALLCMAFVAEGRTTWTARAGLSLALLVLVAGTASTFSRAAIILGVLLLVLSAVMAARARTTAWRSRMFLLGGLVCVGLILVGLMAVLGITGRYGEPLLHDPRWSLFATVADYARGYAPWGAGWGAFEQVFQGAPQNRVLMLAYFNHAHNDWLQLWLELGVIFVLAASAMMLVAGRAAVRAWTGPPGDPRSVMGQAASLALLAMAVHSWFDYPLHSGANLALCSFAFGALLRVTRPDAGAAGPG